MTILHLLVTMLLAFPPMVQADPAKEARELVEKLRSDDIAVRDQATQRLKELGKAAAPELEKAAKDADTEVSGRAKRLLHRLALLESLSPRLQKALPGIADRLAFDGDHAWTEAFLAVAEKCEDSDRRPILNRAELEPLASRAVRGAVSDEEKSALSSSIIRRRIPLGEADLFLLLEDPRHGTRPSIVEALYRNRPEAIVPRLIELTRDERAFRRGRAIEDLGCLGVRTAIPEAVRLLRDADRAVREKAVGALSDLQAKDSTAEILPLLKDSESNVRTCALEALGSLYARDAIPRIVDLLGDKGGVIRECALEILARLDAREAIPRIMPLLKDPEEDVRRAALYTLRDLRAREAISQASALLTDPEESVRSAAITFLDEVDSKQGVAFCVERLKDPDLWTRAQAATWLGEHKEPEAVAGLLEALKDKEDYVAAKAAIALVGLRDRRGLPVLSRVFDTPLADQDEIMLTLAKLGSKDIVPKVVFRLGDKGAHTRAAAVRSLAILDVKEAVPKIEPLLKDPDEFVRAQSVSALCKLMGTEAIPRILPLLQDKSMFVVFQTLHALARIKAWQAEPDVADLLEDLKPEVRRLAASWLARAGSLRGVAELLEDEDGALTALNALRNPEVWNRLESCAAPSELQGTVLQRIEQVSRAAGMKVIVEPAPLGDSKRWLDRTPRDWDPGEPVSVAIALWLIAPSAYLVVFEEDRIRLLPRESGARFWREWWKEANAGKK